jgi:hypothetical protein
MPSHSEFVAAFRAGLATGTLPTGLTAAAPDEAARRFAVYRNNVAHGLIAALRARFPVVERLVGADFFAAMARLFVEAHPPASPLLMHYGTALPGFLERFPPVSHLPYLPDVARLELARGRAYHAGDTPPLSLDRLAAAAAAGADRLRLTLHPSVTLLASRWPFIRIWTANQPGSVSTRVSGTGPEQGLVARRGIEEVTVRALPIAEFRFLAALEAGHAFGAATAGALVDAPDFDPAQPLARLITDGLVIAAHAGDPHE